MSIESMVDAGAKEKLLKLIYEHWVLFDGKMCSVHGVELRFDFPGVKLIAMHPHRWSPAKRVAAQRIIEGLSRTGL